MSEIERDIPFKIKPTLQGDNVVDAVDINIFSSGFDGNLDTNITDVQSLAQAVDDLTAASMPGTLPGTSVTIDNSGFSHIDPPSNVTNAQEAADELDRLFGIVQSGGTQPAPRFDGAFVPFTSSTTIVSDNFETYAGRISLYARSDDARVNYVLPSDATITGDGVPTDEAVEFTILNQAGTARFDTGGGAAGPNNTVRISVPGAANIRRNTETGTLLNFIEAHQNDLVTLTQSARGQPWVSVRVTLSNAALLLPTGIFHLQVGTLVRFPPSLGFIVGIPSGVTPQAGDAYQVDQANDDFGGYGVDVGDVIVALQDSPSRVISAENDDWLVIRNATNDIISLAEIHFLNATNEVDTFADDRLIDDSGITSVRLWLSPFVLDHAPFITPSLDPDNPQAGEGSGEYIGGDELQTDDVEFSADTAAISTFTGEAGSTIAPGAFMYLDLDGVSMSNVDLLDTVYVVIRDRDGREIARHKLTGDDADFRTTTLTGSADTYYVFDDIGAPDNFSSISYHSGYTIDVVQQRVTRSFTLDSAINVLGGIADGSIPIEKLEPNAQALLEADHSLTDAQDAALSGLETGGDPTDWTAGALYVKDNDASATSRESHYFNVGQQNGILAEHGRSRSVTFVVPNFVSVTGLERADNTSIKHDVTSIGTLSLNADDGTSFTGQAFTASLPQSSFDINNPVGDAWIVDGTASNLQLTGAVATFKIDRQNLDENLENHIFGTPDTPSGTAIPEILTQLSNDLTRTTRTESGWRTLALGTARGLTREAAKLWDENARTDTGNVFDDIDDVQFTSFDANNIFYYANADDPYNQGFPGHHSYVENNNVRVSNVSPGTNIMDVAEKIVMFDYSLQRQIAASDGQVNMVRFGSASVEPLLTISHEEGLALSIGRGDGGQRSRTYDEVLTTINGHWHDEIDDIEATEAEAIIPDSATGSITLRIEIQLDNNGNDEGTHVETITITDVASDQTLSQETFDFAGYPSVTLNINYDAVNDDEPHTRRVLFLVPTTAFTNAALTYNVRIIHEVTETWNVPTTYAKYPVNSGDPHDRFGIFDPGLWNTERVRTPEHVAIMLRPYRAGDTDNDPEMAAYVVVDGEHEGQASLGRVIRLHRPKSDFDTSIINIGNNICAVSHIQVYRYEEDNIPTEAQFYQLTTGEDNWLNAFTDSTDITDRFIFNADLQILDKLLIRSTGTQILKEISVDDANVITAKDA